MQHTRQLLCAAGLALALTLPAHAAMKEKPSELALVVLDKKCDRIVEPYKISVIGREILLDGAKAKAGMALDRVLFKKKPDDNALLEEARLRAKRSNWLPMKTEVIFGERSHAQETNILARDSKMGKKLYPLADAMLDDINNKIGEEHDYKFQLFILKNSTRNAIARPGGFLYLDQGLLDDPSQFSKAHFALAHEIAHVLQRHETRELQGMIVDSFRTKKDLEDAIRKSHSDPAVVLEKVEISKGSYTRHHIDQELQADSCSARLLARVYASRTDLADAVNGFLKDLPPPQAPAVADAEPASQTGSKAEAIAAKAHDIVTIPASRHPNTQERTQNLVSIYKELATKTLAQGAGGE